jgi:aminoglycoside phosphotransferase (APT) family kinase protein
VRRAHDAQAGFVDPGGWVEPDAGPVVCFFDYFPPNVIFRDGLPVALIDWDLARPGERAHDVAAAASWWAPLRPDAECERWGFPLDRRGERLRLLCDGYGLEDRRDIVERAIALRRAQHDVHRRAGDEQRLRRTAAAVSWLEEHRRDLEEWL